MAGFDLNNLLNGKSKANTQKSEVQRENSSFQVVMIDVEDLMPSKDNFYSTENIEELAVSIELAGSIEQNLLVKPQVHGKYEVIAGHRRRLAALKLVNEGKEEYRKVPCRIKTESDKIKDKLSLIFTNSTTRQLTDWEKIQQAKELKEVLLEYKKVLEEENKEKPKEERIKLGRIRDIVAQMLNMSTTQVGRMEAIENNLSKEFKQELEKGNIGISTAHELSRLDEEKQAQVYAQYEEKGELHIKDVRKEEKEEITDEQVEQAQIAIKHAMRGEVNRAIFRAKDTIEIEKVLRKYFEKSYQGSEVELENGTHFIYRFSNVGITLIDKNWENYGIDYAELAEIVAVMIESQMLERDKEEIEDKKDVLVVPREENTSKQRKEDIKETTSRKEIEEQDSKEVEGQLDINDYPEYVPEPLQKGLSFTEWIQKKYSTGQYNMIQKVVRNTLFLQAKEDSTICFKEWEDKLTNSISIWVMEKTKEYQAYLQS